MDTFLEHLRGIINLKLIETSNFTLSVYNILITLLILLVTTLLLRGVKRVFEGLVTRNVLDKGTSHSLFLIIKYLVWVIIIVLLIDSMGFKVSILIARCLKRYNLIAVNHPGCKFCHSAYLCSLYKLHLLKPLASAQEPHIFTSAPLEMAIFIIRSML